MDSPVGARLQHFAPNWTLIGAEDWVTQALSKRYLLPIEGESPLTRDPPTLDYATSHHLYPELLVQLDVLLTKHAVEEVFDHSPGFYSRLLLVSKKTGDWRPVIDLSALNEYMSPPRFQMETLQSILTATQGQVGHINRPEGCILSHTNSCQTPEVPTLHSDGSDLPVSGSDLPVPRTKAYS